MKHYMMDDTTIIVYEISGQEIDRCYEIERFNGWTNEEIVDSLCETYGKDISIKRVRYDENNIPSSETLYDSDYMYDSDESN